MNHYKSYYDEILLNNNLCKTQGNRIALSYEVQIWPIYFKAEKFLIHNFSAFYNHRMSLQKLLGVLHYIEIAFLEKKTQMDKRLTPEQREEKEKVIHQISQQIFICLQLGIF